MKMTILHSKPPGDKTGWQTAIRIQEGKAVIRSDSLELIIEALKVHDP